MNNIDTNLLLEAYKNILEKKITFSGMDIAPNLLNFSKSLNDIPEEIEDVGYVAEANDPSELGSKIEPISDEEMKKYLGRTTEGGKTKQDKYKLPYIHRGNIETIKVIDDNGEEKREIDIESFKKLISVRPEKLIKQNDKMKKTGGETQSFYNTSLPALKGLIVNEKTNQFIVVDTCPSSGICKTYCYAKKGGYVQWKASSLSQTRILNFLMNDWSGYKENMLNELKSISEKNTTKGIKTVLRWNDSGDMLSDKYFEIVMDIVRQTPEVQHYAYTKEVSKAKQYKNIPKNFIFNFSFGGLQDKELLSKVDKISVVVPDVLIKPYISKIKINTDKKPIEKWSYNNESALRQAKNKIAAKYSIPVETLLSIEELSNTPKGKRDQYNVIVLPGESDLSASREDVRGTYLILH